ncbi:MAG: hypothetical protein ACKJRS_05440 [Woeseiaceae bacterium]|nr:hypothetical protein [Woeseiaceae bacterium]
MIKVLLIDDDFRHSELLKNYLSRYGMKLDCIGDAEKGLKRFELSDPDLGLYIAKLVARAHGGNLDLDTAYKKGACLVVTLPFEPKF